MKLNNKICLVTGGASGLGYAISDRFLKEGAIVCIADSNNESGEKALKQLLDHRKTGMFVRSDVSSREDAKLLVDAVIKKFGRLDIVVNCAGVLELGSIESFELSTFRKVLSVNVEGVFLVCKYAIPVISDAGAIINIASSLGVKAYKEHGAYCASKAAVIHLSKVMALECACRNIRVNAICPGPIETPMLAKEISLSQDPEEARRSFLEDVPLGRFGKPEEVANLALFLASQESSYITGAAIHVDGGNSLK